MYVLLTTLDVYYPVQIREIIWIPNYSSETSKGCGISSTYLPICISVCLSIYPFGYFSIYFRTAGFRNLDGDPIFEEYKRQV